MNKRKKYKIILPLFIGGLFIIFMIIRANIGFPQKEKMEKFGLNEYVDCDKISIKVTDKKIIGKGISDFPISKISVTIKNNTSKPLDVSHIPSQVLLYSNFIGSIVQNVDYGFGEDGEFDKYYDKEDFKLEAREEKEFVFNYHMYKDINNYENFIYLANDLYKKDFNYYVKKGTLLYKTINLGEFNE